jgi:hypothetical protein
MAGCAVQSSAQAAIVGVSWPRILTQSVAFKAFMIESLAEGELRLEELLVTA